MGPEARERVHAQTTNRETSSSFFRYNFSREKNLLLQFFRFEYVHSFTDTCFVVGAHATPHMLPTFCKRMDPYIF